MLRLTDLFPTSVVTQIVLRSFIFLFNCPGYLLWALKASNGPQNPNVLDDNMANRPHVTVTLAR